MKKLFTLMTALLIAVMLFAQSPEKMNFQAVVRDNNNNLITNTVVGIRISILQNSIPVYVESQKPIANSNGLITISFGGEAGFNKIDWANGSFFIKSEIDPKGGTNYTITGTSQLMSVPYAFHAQTASYLIGDDNQILKSADNGVPSQNWSLFGNSKSNPQKDKMGTTDENDLVLVTDNKERLRILSNGDVKLKKSLEIGEDLIVKRNVYLNTESGETINNGPLTVSNESPTLLTGSLTVGGPTHLKSTLTVEDITDLNSALNVNNQSPTYLSGDLTVDGPTVLNNTLNANGQVTINANVTGGDASYDAYPLRVQGSDQGIAIKVNSTNPLAVNNFVTFFNGSGSAVGGIEGQNYAEKEAFPPFAYERGINIATEVKCAAGIALSLIPTCVGGVVVSCGVSGSSIALAAADLILASANLAAFEVFLTMFIGVTYSSGSADYAEWLERAYPEELISSGDIVAVNGGKITKYTEDALQIMAISSNPAILGNVPTDGNVSKMEKVAFMGQIPVKVRGLVLTGDYILPSGLHDGTGIAISPNEITSEQYRKIVGVAWSTSLLENGISYINMAIGLNSNDVATLVVKQEKKLSEMENKYKSLEERLNALEKGTVYSSGKEVAEVPTTITDKKADEVMTREEILATQWPSEFTDEVMKDAIFYLESEFNRRGVNIASHTGLQRLFTDMDFQADVIKRAKETYKATYKNIQMRPTK